jgi:hypothetical protein
MSSDGNWSVCEHRKGKKLSWILNFVFERKYYGKISTTLQGLSLGLVWFFFLIHQWDGCMENMQCNVTFGYQLSIGCRTEENHGQPRHFEDWLELQPLGIRFVGQASPLCCILQCSKIQSYTTLSRFLKYLQRHVSALRSHHQQVEHKTLYIYILQCRKLEKKRIEEEEEEEEEEEVSIFSDEDGRLRMR